MDLSNNIGGGGAAIPCFLKGTKIQIDQSISAPVEHLEAGQFILTADGYKCLRWLAHVFMSYEELLFFPEHLPIVFELYSLTSNTPNEQLILSPNHFLLVDSKLVSAGSLVNGNGIFQDNIENYTRGLSYYHLEFDSEVFVFSHGVKSTSFLDIGNSSLFDNVEERPLDLASLRSSDLLTALEESLPS